MALTFEGHNKKLEGLISDLGVAALAGVNSIEDVSWIDMLINSMICVNHLGVLEKFKLENIFLKVVS